MARETGPQADEQLVRLTNELLDRWAPVLQGKDWAKRLALLGQIHEQLQEDIKDLETYCAVSPMFIAGLIERLGTGEVDSVEQAHIYSNSGNEAHRHMAGLWLARHQGMN